LRVNKSVALPRRLLFLDSETKKRGRPGEERDYAYLAWTCFMELRAHNKKGYTEIWRFWEDMTVMWNWIEALTAKKMTLYVVASNVTFDLVATGGVEHLTDCGWTMVFYHEAAKMLILKLTRQGRTIVFLNLQNFYPMGIGRVGKLLGIEKGKVNFETDDFGTVKEYCKNDVEILKRAFLGWLEFIEREDMGRWGLTYAAQAFNAYRHRYMQHKILPLGDSQEDSFCRPGYFGGRVECFWIGKGKEGDFTMLDVNSMYPYVMRENWYPSVLCGQAADVPPSKLPYLLDNYCLVGDCVVNTEEPVYPVRREGKMVFPTGVIDVVLGSEGIRYAHAHGHLMGVSNLYIFHREKLFTDWVEGMYQEKRKAKEEGDKLRGRIYKLLMNSLYGKFGQMSPNVIEDEYTEETAFESRKVYYDDTPDSGMEYTMFHRHFQTKGRKPSAKSNVAIALHVTEYARFVLWEYIKKAGVENVFYCDTDSLIVNDQGCKNLQTSINRTTLGMLSVERRGKTLTVNAPKDYKLGSYKRQKGIRSDAVQTGVNTFQQVFFPGFKTLLRKGIKTGFPIGTIEKKLEYNYTKGIVGSDGRVTPLQQAPKALSLLL